MFVCKILIPIFICQIVNGNNDINDISSLLRDFLKTTNFPTKITAFLCWTSGDLKNLEKMLFDENYFVQIVSPEKNIIPYSLPEEYQVYILDNKCHNSRNILLKADEYRLFKEPFRWIILGSPEDVKPYGLYVSLDSKLFLLYHQSPGIFAIKSIYKWARDSPVLENDVATWSPEVKFHYFNKLSVSKNRSDLHGMEMHVPYVATNPDTLNHLEDYREKHIDSIAKLNYKIVNQLVDIVNMTPIWIPRETWGYKNATTGHYSGMIGDLQSGFASLGGTPCFFTMDRIDIIDFIAATTPTYMKFIFRSPALSVVANVFTLPFDKYVWHYSFIMMAIVAVVVYIIVFWEWKDTTFRSTIEDKQGALRPNILDVIMMEIGAISQQGSDVEPRSSAGRIATIFTFLTLMFMYTSYSANIVALLQSTTDSIRTLQNLLDSRIKLGVEDIVYAHYYFENADEPVRKAIYEQKVAPKGQKPNFMSVYEGIRRVRDEFFGFHVELSTGYKVVSDIFQENEKCSLKEIEYINLVEPWLATRKNSSYKEIFKVGMRRIHETGIQKRELNKIYTKKPVCHNKGSNFVSVGLIDCYYAFVIFLIGIGLGILLLLSEIILNHYKCHYILLGKHRHTKETVAGVLVKRKY